MLTCKESKLNIRFLHRAFIQHVQQVNFYTNMIFLNKLRKTPLEPSNITIMSSFDGKTGVGHHSENVQLRHNMDTLHKSVLCSDSVYNGRCTVSVSLRL